jgi:hypothetical protein
VILFHLPDVDVPAGGMRVTYAVVDMLNEGGMQAAVWHRKPGFRTTWFENQTSILYGDRRELAAGDVLVMPELNGSRYQPLTKSARVVIFNQAHFYTLGSNSSGNYEKYAYPGWPNVVAAIAVSNEIEKFLDRLTPPGFPVYRIPVLLEPMRFRSEPKEKVISMMENRRPGDVRALLHLLDRSDLGSDWEIALLKNMSASEVTDTLARSALFVSTADHDGFSLPGAEAMAAGCYVVGFHGGGAREYMDAAFCTPVEDPDIVALCDEILRAARLFDAGNEDLARRALKGQEFVRDHYSRQQFSDAAIGVFTSVLADTEAQQSRRCRVTHGETLRTPRPRHRQLLSLAASHVRSALARFRAGSEGTA